MNVLPVCFTRRLVASLSFECSAQISTLDAKFRTADEMHRCSSNALRCWQCTKAVRWWKKQAVRHLAFLHTSLSLTTLYSRLLQLAFVSLLDALRP
jgi:hypothetical protein